MPTQEPIGTPRPEPRVPAALLQGRRWGTCFPGGGRDAAGVRQQPDPGTVFAPRRQGDGQEGEAVAPGRWRAGRWVPVCCGRDGGVGGGGTFRSLSLSFYQVLFALARLIWSSFTSSAYRTGSKSKGWGIKSDWGPILGWLCLPVGPSPRADPCGCGHCRSTSLAAASCHLKR